MLYLSLGAEKESKQTLQLFLNFYIDPKLYFFLHLL